MSTLRHNLARFRTAISMAAIGVFVAIPAWAQTGVDLGLDAAASTGLSTVDIRTFVGRIISYFLGLLGIIAVALMMYAGFTWMTANGNEEKIAQAKKIILNATIGLVIIMSAFAIVQFVVSAITGGANGGAGSGGVGGCPPGQVCGLGGGSGGSGAFRVTGIVPAGQGTADRGWPKNYALSVNFTAPVAEGSVSAASVEVRKCNARVNGSGDAQPFVLADCGAAIEGTRTVNNNKIVFKPSTTLGAEPTDFEGNFWYSIRVRGGDLRDMSGRTLVCPFIPSGPTGDIGSSSAQSDLCDRAAGFNDQRDVSPPTVSLDAPDSPPAFCASVPVPIRAVANDDFLAAAVDYLLDGGTANLVDASGVETSSEVNAGLGNPFTSNGVFIDFGALSEGSHTVTAVAMDGVPQSSAPATREFTVNPGHCCNDIRDGDETAVNCGGSCGACSGATCTSDAQCSSGFCDPATDTCAERPVIDSLDPMTAGAGSLVTIRGRFFGRSPGSVVFLGGPEADDDVSVAACVPDAWDDGQIVVQIPATARTGPIRVTTSNGQSDATDDERGPNFGAFNITGPVRPGICFIDPSVAAPGQEFTISGSGFGGSIGTSTVALGAFVPTIATGGWTETRLAAIVPTAPEQTYPVSVTVGGVESNTVMFTVSLSETGAPSAPRIISVSPESGPVGTYVTVNGSGFGRLKGKVLFKLNDDVANGLEPVCEDFWHDNYVVVKVPSAFEGGLAMPFGALPGTAYKVQVTTAAPYRASNDDVIFNITNEPLKPGICSISPDNGPPGKTVEISGTGFGSTSPGSAGADSTPRYLVDFFKGGSATVTAGSYSIWQPSKIGTVVPGTLSDQATWPVSGPVTVMTNSVESANSIPFRVGSCQDGSLSCAAGTTCCANGSCQAPNVATGQPACEPMERKSAYGWLFSTDVLPAFPVVVQNAMCSDDPLPATLQSPSPYKGSVDACMNAEIRIEFSRRMRMDAATLSSAIEFRECGEGESADCSTAAAFASLQFDPRDCDGSSPTDCKTLTFIPPSDYNGDTSLLKEKTWYQVRLISDPASGRGMREGGITEGRWLDGDYDRRAGGDYVFTFRVREGANPCQIASVFVEPPKTTITQDSDPTEFQAVPTGVNCNSLRCSPFLPYTLGWTVEDAYLFLLAAPSVPPAPDSAYCARPVMARAETALTTVTASMSPQGVALAKTGESEVTVKFAEPRVTSVTPVASCIEACINAAIVATFNVPMRPETLEQPGNVELLKCRNASCTAPFLPLGSVARVAGVNPPDGVIGGVNVYRHVTLTGTGNLEPATFYLVRIKSDDPATPAVEGVTSRSGVPLGGTNDGNTYSWKFRTKNDPSACLASSSTISPAQATLYYVGQRQQLSVKPYGSPDACSNAGQELIPSSFAWTWMLPDPNPVVLGFVDGFPLTIVAAAPVATLVDTNPTPRQACTDRCVLRGSQNVVPQCGNGIVERKYEECDPSGANCSSRCLVTGTTAPLCGNGTLDTGENCESYNGVFPSGCKQVGTHVDGFADTVGCVLTGSSTASNSFCGDGLVGDGESCDDGNRGNGDGCSADCLKEGTLPTCRNAAAGTQCVNFCGNGVDEPGEDPSCDPNPGANGCNPATCLKLGAPSRGSSALYDVPSFCGDGIVGTGEDAACEQAPDLLIDAMQVVEAGPQPGFSAIGANMSVVQATTEGIAAADVGASRISLSCTCNTLPAAERDSFCAGFTSAGNLACATNGCCAPRPRATAFRPAGGNNVCRNAAITVSFDQLMDRSSLSDNILVGYDNGSAACPQGTTTIASTGGFDAPHMSLWTRITRAIIGFFDRYVLSPVFGAPATITPNGDNVFCAVNAKITVTNAGDPTPTASVVRVAVTSALPADKWIMIRVLPGARSVSGVTIAPEGYRAYFGTGKDICTVSRVEVSPRSTLFSTYTQPPATLVAHAISSGSEEIVQTTDYGWTWRWTPQSAAAPSVSPIVLEARTEVNGSQTAFADARVRGSSLGDAPPGYVPVNGQAVVQAAAVLTGNRLVTGEANVTVFLCENPWPARRACGADGHVSLPWDPSRSDDSCTIGTSLWSAFYDPQTNYSFYYCRDTEKAGDVQPLLPAFREVPVIVTPGRDIIKEYLFTYDTAVYTPTQSSEWQGDAVGLRISANPEHFGVAQWYASKGFKGGPQALSVDGFDALRDGRTVYVNAGANAGGTLGGSLHTNIGVFSHTDGAAPETVNVFNQIMSNVDFLTVAGFSMADAGSCLTSTVGATVRCNADADCRVDAAGSPDPGKSAFSCDVPKGICKNGSGVEDANAGTAVACLSDYQCQVHASGAFITNTDGTPARTAFVCDAPKQKFVRDVRRWSDLQSMRQKLTTSRANGSLPKLDSGSFLATMSTSTWPSWAAELGAKAGSAMPSDPVNRHAWCESADRDGGTCWDDRAQTYLCPAGSHVYDYEYFQETAGVNFRLRADFETSSTALNATWRGSTCIERTTANCVTPDGLCVVESGACNYKVGKLFVGGVNRVANCSGSTFGTGGVCGDGTVSVGAGEVCEPGQVSSVSCLDSSDRRGLIAQVCASDCRSFVNRAGATCQLGRCGDGVVNGNETCDEGSLNGTYGHCDTGCTGDGFRCGDGARQPGEACDCGERNGQYYFNGRLQPVGGSCPTNDNGERANRNSCAWDCSSAGPRCGDGIRNDTEECDGGFQVSKGFCTTAATLSETDPSAMRGSLAPCETDAQCSGKQKCGHYCPTVEQNNRRACRGNSASSTEDDNNACEWARWKCTAPGSCGNGIKESGEECDDGNADNDDGCIIDPVKDIMCKTAVCGDGYIRPSAGEQCDNGNRNNAQCVPDYSLSCTYCTSQCKTISATGGFCGDNVVQSPTAPPWSRGPEECDGAAGLTDEYICVSTRPETQSYGVRTGTSQNSEYLAICNDNNCLRTCAQPDSAVCRQQACNYQDTSKNSDYYVVRNGVAISGGPGYVAQSGDVTHFGPDNYWLDVQTSYNTANGGIGVHRSLCDSCDPDWDDDGLPNESPADCRKKDPLTHGEYRLTYQDLNNRTRNLVIPAAAERCDDIDNNCNGIIDDTPPVDMIFILDNSQSMDGEIDAIVDGIRSFVNDFSQGCHAFALVLSNLSGGSTYNAPDHLILPFTTNVETFLGAIEKQRSPYGSGTEKQLDVIKDLTTEANLTGLRWRTGITKRIVVVATDSQPHSTFAPCTGRADDSEACNSGPNSISAVNSSVRGYIAARASNNISVEFWAVTTNGVSSGWQQLFGADRWRRLEDDADDNKEALRSGPFAAVCQPSVAPACEELEAQIAAVAPVVVGPICGDGTCDDPGTERCSTFGNPGECAADCGACPVAPAVCGDNICQAGELRSRGSSTS